MCGALDTASQQRRTVNREYGNRPLFLFFLPEKSLIPPENFLFFSYTADEQVMCGLKVHYPIFNFWANKNHRFKFRITFLYVIYQCINNTFYNLSVPFSTLLK